MMSLEKEDLGLSLSLSSTTTTTITTTSSSSSSSSSIVHGFPRFNFMPSSSVQPPFPFSCNQKIQWSNLLVHHSEKRQDLDGSGRAEETRPLPRGIDVNRAPSAATAAEMYSEEDAGASSPNSSVSTLSGGKRPAPEHDARHHNHHHMGSGGGADEHDAERASSRGISDEEDGDGSRKKLRLSKDQSAILEETFKEHNTLNPKQKLALAKHLNLRPRQVEVWFQNRRARTKLKQTEMDCEFLKRCCENLTEENRRLQKEVQELRAFKLSPQFFMHATPPTTLTMCPSCERVSNSAASTAPTTAAPAPASEQHRHPFVFVPHHHRPAAAAAASSPWAPIPLRSPLLDSAHPAIVGTIKERSRYGEKERSLR